MNYYKGQRVRFVGVDTSMETDPHQAKDIEEAILTGLGDMPFFVVTRDSVERKGVSWVGVEGLDFDLTHREGVPFEEEINYEEIVG